jgi:hypothetical protein
MAVEAEEFERVRVTHFPGLFRSLLVKVELELQLL